MIEAAKFIDFFKNIKLFDDVYDITCNLNNKEKGDFFELITLYLFKLSPMLNNKLQNIWLYDEIPNKIKRDLKLPNKDKGIDLLAIIDDEYYAIQSKFRQNKDSIVSWADLSTFFGLSFGINNKIKGGFLVTNTYDLCDEVINSDKIEPVYGDFFDNLPNNFFSNIIKIINKQRIDDYIRKTPLKHQQECINKCDDYYKNHKRGYIEMACGSGKTLTAYWIDKKLGNKLTIVLVPSLYLLSQFYQDWVDQSYSENAKINYILIGSDADVSEDTKYKSNGLILELDTKNIKQLIEKYKYGKTVIISTYQSSDKLFNTVDSFDFAIFDEAHKTVGQVGKQFSLMIKDSDDEDNKSENNESEYDESEDDESENNESEDNESEEHYSEEDEMEESDVDENDDIEEYDAKIIINKRLFMTATPKNYAGYLDDEQIISMDNEKFYGKEIYSYNTGMAIQDKRLIDYQLVTMVAKNNDIQQSIISNKLVKYKKLLDSEESNYLAIVLIILKKIHDNTCNHMVTYHNAIKRSKKFAELLTKINQELYKEDIFIESLDGSFSMAKRNRIIKEFANNKKGILCSARVLNEGVNIPIIDSVCFVDNRSSTIDIVQCIGRSLRLYDNKKMANIVVPIFVDNLDDIMESSTFGGIISILKALKSTDQGIAEYFVVNDDDKKSNKRKILKYEMYGKISKDIEISLNNWKNNIETTVWKIIDPFEEKFNALKCWININSRIPSQESKNAEEKTLGRWCARQRNIYRSGLLNKTKIDALNSLNEWFWTTDSLFYKNYTSLCKWIDDNNKLPSQYGKNIEERKLAAWCSSRKDDYKKGRLDQNKVRMLGSLKLWYWSANGLFDLAFNRLKQWINQHKRLPSQNSINIKEKNLGKWCQLRKNEYKKNKMNQYKINLLGSLENWTWTNDEPFEKIFTSLLVWIKLNGKLPSPNSQNLEEKKLGQWCSTKKDDYRNNLMSDSRIKLFSEIELWTWNNNDYLFDKHCDSVIRWVAIHGKLPSQHCKDTEEKRLGRWCSNKKVEYKKNKLSDDRVNKLLQIKGWNFPEKKC